MNTTVKETIESLQKLIRELRKYPEDATVETLFYQNNGMYCSRPLSEWTIGDVTENSVDILF